MTTATFDRESYVDKVRKLLAKAEGAATEAEAEAFFAKAADLIGKWEIEEAELADAKQAGPASWVINNRIYNLSSYSPKQDASAMNSVARAMGLKAYFTAYVRGCEAATLVVFGTDDDLDRFEMMWASVSLQMTRFMKLEEKSTWNRNQQRAFRLGFKVGFGTRIGERIAAARSKATSRALVLVGKADAIEKAMPETRQTKVRANAAAAEAGRRAADKADINKHERVTSSKTRAAISS
jgi:hypothetical protein